MGTSKAGGPNPISRSPRGLQVVAALLGLLIGATGAARAAPLQLVTDAEARLPNGGGIASRGIMRGPSIMIVTPAAEAGLIRSPFRLKVRFVSHGGSQIVPESILVTYEKMPAIDLTQRLQPYIDEAGIDVVDTAVPPGEHRIRVDVADTLGHASSARLTIRVGP